MLKNTFFLGRRLTISSYIKNLSSLLRLLFFGLCLGYSVSLNIAAAGPITPKNLTIASSPRYYVATNGNDLNPGTIDLPFLTWAKAWSVVEAGDTVYIRGGIYYPDPTKASSVILTGKSGLPGKYIRFFAYPGETPVLDCSNVTHVGNIVGIRFIGDYCYFKGIEITGIVQPINPSTGHGYFCMGFYANNSSNNIFRDLNIHHNGGTGLHIQGTSCNNLIINSDFHNNYDPYTYSSNGVPYPGGNADGLSIGSIPNGCRNTVSGCRFWWNSDDGIDLINNEGIVTIQNTWSFWNGYQPGTFISSGDGAGYKLGGTSGIMDNDFQRIIKNCVAYDNRKKGFDQNGANVLMAVYNNTSYKNGHNGFDLSLYPLLRHVVKNNIAYANLRSQCVLSQESDHTNNSWNGFSVTDSDFLSIVATGIDGARMTDGSLPDISFLKLAITSGLINQGIDVGLPFTGAAPDLGAFEAN